jgi:DNA transformation protein
MGKSSSEFVEFIKEQLAPLGELVTARFFGGIGLSVDGTQFGMLMDNSAYFVVDDTTRSIYQKMGSNSFSYITKNGRVKVNRYFEVPSQALDEPAQLLVLAIESITVAKRTSEAKGKKSKTSLKRDT